MITEPRQSTGGNQILAVLMEVTIVDPARVKSIRVKSF